MTISAAALTQVAEGQVGYVEQGGRDGHSGNLTQYGKAFGLDGYAWCSIWVWWCFHAIGVDVKHDITSSYASADAALHGFAKHGWEIHGHDPLPGDVVFFHFSGEHAGANHTGIVISHDAGGVHTVEGNTSSGEHGSQVNGGGVYRRYRPWSVIIGFGRYPWPATPAPAPVAYPTLQYPMGSKQHPSSAVHNMQRLLHVPADGIFTRKTSAQVANFQKRHHLVSDGVAGPATLRVLGFSA